MIDTTNATQGQYHVVQVIPCVAPLYEVYSKDSRDEEFFCNRLHFVGLCADGEVRALTLTEGRFEVVGDNVKNFCGIIPEKRLPGWGLTATE